MACFIGIDVGTGSARAGVFDRKGVLLGTASAAITTFRPQPEFAQQSSDEIWEAVCRSTRQAVSTAGIDESLIAGIGFDATCSLVVSGDSDIPVSISPDQDPRQDVILWMDHRAVADAEEITSSRAEVLEHVGGAISPEMQMPKLRWLKRELPQSWENATTFWDLPDWLVHRATSTDVRSMCSAVCKWTYLGHRGISGEGWDDEFLERIGLGDLAVTGHSAIGNRFLAAGECAGRLSAAAAQEMGLPTGIAVSTALIDAYSGALGTLGARDAQGEQDISGRLALIAGTSTCHICLTPNPVFIPGIWGPYYSVLLPGMWANEGGQSAAGALIDAVIARHSAVVELPKGGSATVAEFLERHLSSLSAETARLTSDRHVQPDFHGNRSPLAQAWRKGAVSGLTLDHGLADLALDYLATVQALAYGTRHIVDGMKDAGMVIDTLVVSGGLARNSLFLREHADATGCRILVPDQTEPVLLGSAMMGAVAAGTFGDLTTAMGEMSGAVHEINPRVGEIAAYHHAKYSVFRRMQADYADYASLMDGAQAPE